MRAGQFADAIRSGRCTSVDADHEAIVNLKFVRGHQLPSGSVWRNTAAYVKASNNRSRRVLKSRVDTQGGSNPRWNQTVQWTGLFLPGDTDAPGNDTLRFDFNVYDQGTISDAALGKGCYAIDAQKAKKILANGGKQVVKVPLKRSNRPPRGTLEVEVHVDLPNKPGRRAPASPSSQAPPTPPSAAPVAPAAPTTGDAVFVSAEDKHVLNSQYIDTQADSNIAQLQEVIQSLRKHESEQDKQIAELRRFYEGQLRDRVKLADARTSALREALEDAQEASRQSTATLTNSASEAEEARDAATRRAETLHAECERLSTQVTDLSAQARARNKAQRDAENERAIREQEAERVRRTTARIHEETLTSLREEISELRSKVKAGVDVEQAVRAELERANKRGVKKANYAAAVERKLDQCKSQVETLRGQLTAAQNGERAAEDRLSEERRSHQAEIDRVHNVSSALREQLAALQATTGQQRSELEQQLQSAVSAKESVEAQLTAARAMHGDNAAALREERAAHSADIDRLHAEADQLRASLGADVHTATTENANLQRQIVEARQTVVNLQHQVSAARRAADVSSTALAEERAARRSDVDRLEAQIAELHEDYGEQLEEAADDRGVLTVRLQKDAAALRQSLSEATHRAAAAETEVKMLNEQLATLQESASRDHAALLTARRALGETQNTLSHDTAAWVHAREELERSLSGAQGIATELRADAARQAQGAAARAAQLMQDIERARAMTQEECEARRVVERKLAAERGRCREFQLQHQVDAEEIRKLKTANVAAAADAGGAQARADLLAARRALLEAQRANGAADNDVVLDHTAGVIEVEVTWVANPTMVAESGRRVDLDLSAVCFGVDGNFVEACYFGKLQPFGDEAIVSMGDARGDAESAGESKTRSAVASSCGAERIVAHLEKLEAHGIHHVFFVVTSFSGVTFSAVDMAQLHIKAGTGQQLVPSLRMGVVDKKATSLVAARIVRRSSSEGGEKGWVFRPMGVTGQNKCFADVVPLMQVRRRPALCFYCLP